MKKIICAEFTGKAQALRAEGYILSAIAERLGCSRQTVANAIGSPGRAGNGGKRRGHAPRKLTPLQEQEVLALVKRGLSKNVIARMHYIGRSTVYQTIWRMAA